MNGINPKWGAYLGLLVVIEQAIGHGTVSLTNLVPLDWAPYITSWCNFLAFIGTSIMTYQAAVSSPASGPLANTSIAPAVKAAILLAALLGSLALPGGAHAQLKTPQQIISDLKNDNAALKQKVTSSTAPAPASDAPLPCTFQMLIKLTPTNLLSTINQCIANKLVADTQRALSSASDFGTSGKGDADAVNCLTPALAIFQAGVEIPAVMSADGTTVVTPAQDPGPILLYQKYREFTLSGALTSCQAWFNGPINATVAAGIAGAGTVLGGAALLAPK